MRNGLIPSGAVILLYLMMILMPRSFRHSVPSPNVDRTPIEFRATGKRDIDRSFDGTSWTQRTFFASAVLIRGRDMQAHVLLLQKSGGGYVHRYYVICLTRSRTIELSGRTKASFQIPGVLSSMVHLPYPVYFVDGFSR